MAVSYNRLWKQLIDRGMKKKDLAAQAGISVFSLTKMTRGENMTTDVLVKICRTLSCTMDDIMEILPDDD